ncbi:universal stress protein [Streptomyces longispororuber]|uniref:universal stress protein n=1 Tax=Streptomyces longispororuber TaxID=68230 RepID=UPI0036F5592A
MELPVVVGVDGSEPSLRAVDWAVDEAALHGVPLRLVYASLWERYEGPALAQALGKPTERERADAIVVSAAARAERRNPDVKISAEAVRADAVGALLREGRNASMVVVASRGRGGLAELLLGSVSLGVAARASCPVIVLRDGRAPGARTRAEQRIVLGVGDTTGEAAVRFAFQEAADRYACLHAVHAWRCPAPGTPHAPLTAAEPVGDLARHAADRVPVRDQGTPAADRVPPAPDRVPHAPDRVPTCDHEQQATDRLEEALRDAAREHPSVRVRRRPVEGGARTALLRAAAAADLLVVGARRRRGHLGLQLGRVAHAVLHHSACPVAVVPQRE